jgi:hypothetical protein
MAGIPPPPLRDAAGNNFNSRSENWIENDSDGPAFYKNDNDAGL